MAIFDLNAGLQRELKKRLPEIVGLLNNEYTDRVEEAYNGEPVQAPQQYQKGIRSDILEQPGASCPIVTYGFYSSQPTQAAGQQRASFARVQYRFYIQVWLADTVEGRVCEVASIWEDGLKFFVKNYLRDVAPNLDTPDSPDIDITNSEPDGGGWYRAGVQASGLITRNE
jgi:hypothetical protein